LSVQRRPVPPRTIYLVAALAVLVLLCASLAFCVVASPRPAPVALPVVQASEEAAQSGEDKINAAADAPLGPYTVQMSEEEATSLLALRLPGSPFLNPQVRFRDGKVYISGIVNMGVNIHVQSQWIVVDDGLQPRIKLDRASIGPSGLPTILLNSVSSTINQMIDESGTGILPTVIRIEDGAIVIVLSKATPTIP
jgi:hypothetical protein